MLAKLKKAQDKSPEALAAALAECNKALNVRNADKSTPAKTKELQCAFIEDGGAEFCLELVQKNVHAQLAWEALWYASRPATMQVRVACVPELVATCVQALQNPATAVPAANILANVARGEETGVPLAQRPGLLEAAVKAVPGPAAVPALVLLANLAAHEANKAAMAQTPGLFTVADQAVAVGGDVGARARALLDLLQKQRVQSVMAVPALPVVPAMPVLGGAPESESMSAQQVQLMMMQQQMAHQQQMMTMMMMQNQSSKQQPTTVVVNNRTGGGEDDGCGGCFCELLTCLICISTGGLCPCDDRRRRGWCDD